MAEQDTAEDITGQFQSIVKDLFNIEVNTILRDKISAQKMPSPRNALLDIGIEYFEILREMERAYRRAERDKNPQLAEEFDIDKMRRGWKFYTEDEKNAEKITDELLIVESLVCEHLGGFGAFAIVRKWADKFLQDSTCDTYLEKKHLSVLPRIKENADMLKGMFSEMCRRDNELRKDGLIGKLDEIKKVGNLTPETVVQESRKIDKARTLSLTNQYARSDILGLDDIIPLPMKHSELVLVRKIWEVGTEVIAMQTTIQVDGDVITRLNPNYLDDKVYQKLSDYHKGGVDMALTYWGNLITIAKDLLGRWAGK